MKNAWGVVQTLLGLVAVAVLIAAIIVAFRSISARPGAAPAATGATGYPPPARTQSGYPAPGPTPSNAPTAAPTSAVPLPADSPDQFDPKTYGLPDTIAGYKVLGVVTSENTACRPPGRNTVVLQTTDPTVQDYLKNSRAADVMKALAGLGLNTTKWDFSIVGLYYTREQLVASAQANNHEMEKYGCAYSGGPIILVPTPTSQNP
jgi:hypothetical protein